MNSRLSDDLIESGMSVLGAVRRRKSLTRQETRSRPSSARDRLKPARACDL